MRFAVRSSLQYDVKSPAVFILNLEAAALHRQRIIVENLSLNPTFPVERFADDEGEAVSSA